MPQATEYLRALQGKTIATARIESVEVDDDHWRLDLEFTDGTTFAMRSQDADGYQSWFDYSFGRVET